ncbi:MAG: hypothetical protein ACTSX7_03395 [Alphaproteobacteria bacterium]
MTDIVVEYGRQIAWLSKGINRLDEEIAQLRSTGRVAEQVKAQRTFNLMMDKRYALDTMIAETQATSLKGAMVQVMVASNIGDLAGDYEGFRELEAERQIDKLLHSIVGVLEAHTGVDRAEFGGESYMPERWNPFDWQQEAA